MNEYFKKSQIFLICHSLENEINESKLKFITNHITTISGSANVYMIGCKYDLKVMADFQLGNKITTLKFPNENLASYGQKIKKIINSPPANKGYYLTSSLLNFNIRETFNEIIFDYIYENLQNTENNQNCNIF